MISVRILDIIVFCIVTVSVVLNANENCTSSEWDTKFGCTTDQDNKTVNCTGRNIVVVSGCTNFTNFTINLSRNKVGEFNGDGLSPFKGIDLSQNNVNVFKPDKFLAVEVLNISHNNVNEIKNLFFLSKLTNLDASHNRIETINWFELTELKVLNISYNRLKVLNNLTYLNNIEHLDASNNLIKAIEIKVDSLKYLDLSSNSFQDAKNLSAKSLETLILSKINAENLSNFSKLESLVSLDLSQNNIKNLSDLYKFLGPKVLRINLANNKITHLTETFLDDLSRNRSENITLNVQNNSLHKNTIRTIVDKASNVNRSDDCTCADVYYHMVRLYVCYEEDTPGQCLLDKSEETTTSPTTPATPQPERTIVDNNDFNNNDKNHSEPITQGDNSAVYNYTLEMNSTEHISHAFYFLASLGPAKLSFLGFLLLTLIVLIVINYIVGDPVVDDYWWEEKQPGDRPVT